MGKEWENLPKRVRSRLDWFASRGWRSVSICRKLGRYRIELTKRELLPLFGYSEFVIVEIDSRGRFFPIKSFGESYVIYE